MNYATRLTKLALLLIVAGALALAGCGGDDNGGLSAEDMARIDNADAAAAAAMAAQATAEADAAAAMAAQATAEADAAAAMAAQATADAAAAAAMAAQATAEMNATEAMAAQAVAKAAQTKAEADLDEAEMALAAANEAKTMAEIAKAVAESEAQAAETAQAAAETAQATAEAAQVAAKIAQAAAEADRDRYKAMYEEATDVPSVGTQVGAEGRADSWRIANAVSAAKTTDSATSEMTTARTKKGVSAAKLMRDDDGVSFTVMQGTLAQMTTAADAADAAAPSLAGWQGTALAKTAGGTTQNALVYTDIERSVTPFSSKHPYTVNSDGDPALADSRTHFHAAGEGKDLAFFITGASAHDYISIDHAVSSANTKQSDVASIRGSYDGVPGVYTCATGTCDIEWYTDGVKIKILRDEDLLFQADDIATLIPDPDYQTFGVWMIAQDGPVTGNSGLIRPIAMANASIFNHEDLVGRPQGKEKGVVIEATDGLKGSATYTGQAAGYYATRNAGSFEAESGRFTATATLKASFDALEMKVPTDFEDVSKLETAVKAAEINMPTPLTAARAGTTEILNSGEYYAEIAYYRVNMPPPGVSFAGSKIDKFMAEAEDGTMDGTMMEGWVVNLNGGSLRRPDDISVRAQPADGVKARHLNAVNNTFKAARLVSTFEGMAIGTSGAMEWSGVWDATLHGNTKAALPTGVVGTFQADAGMAVPELVDGAINQTLDEGFAGVVGSFGARR